MRLKRIIALVLSLLMLTLPLSLSACNFEGASGSVYWLNYKPELDDALQQLAARYQEETGVTVKVVTPQSETYRQTLREEMASDTPPTLFVINNQESKEEWKDAALELTDTEILKQLNNSDYNYTDEEGKVIAIPYCIECFGIAVNPELIEKVGYSVDDINDFDTLKTLAVAIHNNAFWLGYDAFCSPDLDADNAWRITAHLTNLEYYLEEDDSVTWKECPASITGSYLPEFKNLYDLILNNAVCAPEETAAGGHDPKEEFLSGKAAFFLTGSWDYAALAEEIPDVTMIPYYCGVKGEEKTGLSSGSENMWAVNANAAGADQKATLEFMKWLVTDENASKTLSDELGNIPYKKAAESENGFLEKQEEYMEDGRHKMIWLSNYQPNVDVYRADLVTALTAYNRDQNDDNWEKVKTAFVDGWAKQYDAVYNNDISE